MPQVHFQEITSQQEIKEYFFPDFWSELKEYFFYFVKVLLIVGVLYIFVRSSIAEKVAVTGISMQPNYNESLIAGEEKTFTNQDKVIIDKITPKFSSYKRGEVVVIVSPDSIGAKESNGKNPSSEKTLFFKRVIGLPGESIRFENGKVYIINESTNSKGFELNESQYLKPEVQTFKNVFDKDDTNNNVIKIPENFYFVMGDNRSRSNDSRVFGPIESNSIRGRELYRLEPAITAGWSTIPSYKSGK
jgi:signal peptidase I